MKKCILYLLLAALLLCGCTGGKAPVEEETAAPSQHTTAPEETHPTAPPHQEFTAQSGTFDPKQDLRISLPQVGLENVFIQGVSNKDLLDKDVWGTVFLLGDDRGGHGADCYLAVTTQDTVHVYDCALWENMSAIGAALELEDFDGDGYSEILLQQAVDAFGGAGQYVSRVFDFQNGSFETLFCSIIDNKLIDTGFSLQIPESDSYTITNSCTGYTETFSVQKDDQELFLQLVYDKDGNPSPDALWVDSFYTFESTDVNNDGIYEIMGKQYSCLGFHSNWFGDCCTVWSYNRDTGAFELTDAWFEPKS